MKQFEVLYHNPHTKTSLINAREEYFEIEALSNSGIKLLSKSIASFINMKGMKVTKAMQLGTTLHAYLEEDFANKYVIEDINRTTTNGKNRAAEIWGAGKQYISTKDAEGIKYWERNMKYLPVPGLPNISLFDYCFNNPFPIIKEGVVVKEENVAGVDITIKIMADVIDVENGLFIDWKTTKSCATEHALNRTVLDMNYQVQAALYCDVLEALYDRPFQAIYFFFEKESPFGIRPYMFDKSLLDYGRETIIKGKYVYSNYIQHKERYMNGDLYSGYDVNPVIGYKPKYLTNNNSEDSEL